MTLFKGSRFVQTVDIMGEWLFYLSAFLPVSTEQPHGMHAEIVATTVWSDTSTCTLDESKHDAERGDLPNF